MNKIYAADGFFQRFSASKMQKLTLLQLHSLHSERILCNECSLRSWNTNTFVNLIAAAFLIILRKDRW